MDTGAGLAEIARAYHREVDAALDGAAAALARAGRAVSCVTGCAWCCRLPVLATVPEGALAAEYVRTAFTAAELSGLSDRLEGWLAWYEARPPMPGLSVGPGCPFLSGHLCAIYPGRPMGCRVHSSTADPALCGPEAGNTAIFASPGVVPEVVDAVKPVCMDYRQRLESMGVGLEDMVRPLPALVLVELKKV